MSRYLLFFLSAFVFVSCQDNNKKTFRNFSNMVNERNEVRKQQSEALRTYEESTPDEPLSDE